MGEKKRKRSAEDADAEVESKKSRVADPALDREVPILSTKKPTGLSRQEKSERRSKKAKKSAEKSKEKHTKDGAKLSDEQPNPSTDDALVNGSDFVPLNEATTTPGKRKKPKKQKKESKPSNVDKGAGDGADAPATKTSNKDDRFICFIGNLPYSATSEQIRSHFIKIAGGIKSIRVPTEKTTGKGKGFAFLDFDGFDKMKTCLKLYHHSIFDPSVETEDKEAKPGQRETGKGRRINVDLTVGGGGSGKLRKEKIHAKNRKLDEQRERAHLKEKEEAAQGRKKEREEKKKVTTGANGVVPTAPTTVVEDRGAIHPSRMNRVAR